MVYGELNREETTGNSLELRVDHSELAYYQMMVEVDAVAPGTMTIDAHHTESCHNHHVP